MKKSVRTTISIAASLKARMDEVGEGVNWSAVASQAFESKVAEFITKRGVRDMGDVISRLRASKAKDQNAAIEKGRAEGRRWAMEEAEAAELQRLSEGKKHSDGAWRAMFNTELNDPFTISYIIMKGLGEDGDGEGQEGGRMFWRQFLGDRYIGSEDDAAFVEGFLTGAIDLWEEVEHKL